MTSFALMYKKLCLICVLLIGCNALANGQTIKGKVFDLKTGEPLIGATVHIEQGSTKLNSIVKLDGTYQFKNIPTGAYKLQVKFIGYTSKDQIVEVAQGSLVTVNVSMVDNNTALTEVNITGHTNRETERAAQTAEKAADNTVNIVSANAIAISPDITVANVMQRVSGVSVERGNSGEGQYAIIRGMDKRYNTTLINGVKIPSPDDRDRYVPLDIFPADLVERIEVYKTLTPNMEADATGGVINMVMKHAPDGLRIEGNVGTGYSQIFANRDFIGFDASTKNHLSPSEIFGPASYASLSSFPYSTFITSANNKPVNTNANLTLGNRFINKKLGVIVAGSYQNTYSGNNSFALAQTATVTPSVSIDSIQQANIQDIRYRQYSTRSSRLGLISTIDYNFNKNNSISLFTTYLQLNADRVRIDETDGIAGGTYIYKGGIGIKTISNKIQTRETLQDIYSVMLQGKNKLIGSLSANWSLVASEAKRQAPYTNEFSYSQDISYTSTSSPPSYGAFFVDGQKPDWQHNTDKDISGYVNFNWDTKIAGHKTVIGFGGMARNKNRDNYNNYYSLSIVNDPGGQQERFVSIPNSKFIFLPDNLALGNLQNAGIYTFKENVQGLYGQIKYFINDDFDILLGLRAENTSQDFTTSVPVTVAGKYGSISYTDYLPSINGKYSFKNNGALRFSYFQSIYRPAYADVIPFSDNTSNEAYAVSGNPYLQHTVVDNYDLRYELFQGALDQYMIGAFYKHITNPIEYALVQQNRSAELTLQPNNFGDATNYGLELVLRKFFGNFGVSGNYTYTHSLINSSKEFDYYDKNGPKYTQVSQQRPLQGQSANIGNFSFLYKDVKNGLDAQLAMVYTGERINTLSFYYNMDNWEKATINLDLSAQKTFHKNYIFYIKANNLLNTPYELIIKQNNPHYNGAATNRFPSQASTDYITVQKDQFNARYLLGFRFKF